MSWIRDHYKTDDDGNFSTRAEYDRARENGDVDEGGYDDEGNRYDEDGDLW